MLVWWQVWIKVVVVFGRITLLEYTFALVSPFGVQSVCSVVAGMDQGCCCCWTDNIVGIYFCVGIPNFGAQSVCSVVAGMDQVVVFGRITLLEYTFASVSPFGAQSVCSVVAGMDQGCCCCWTDG
jgi:hypothetical protein